MSNYSALKTAIQQAVYTNGNNEITGAGLQSVLLQIVNTVGDGYVFKGVATAGTAAGTPDANVFYIAPAGTYNNFGDTSYTVYNGEVGVFMYNGSWNRTSVPLADSGTFFADIQATPTAIWHTIPSQAAGKNVLMRADVDTDNGISLYVFNGNTRLFTLYRGFWQHCDFTSYNDLRLYVASETSQSIKIQVVTSMTLIEEMERSHKIVELGHNSSVRDGGYFSPDGTYIGCRIIAGNSQSVYPNPSGSYNGLGLTGNDLFVWDSVLSQWYDNGLKRIINEGFAKDILHGLKVTPDIYGYIDAGGQLHNNSSNVGNSRTDLIQVMAGMRVHLHGGYVSNTPYPGLLWGYKTKYDGNTADNVQLSLPIDRSVQDYIITIPDGVRYIAFWSSTSQSFIGDSGAPFIQLLPPKNTAYDIVVDASGGGDFTDLYQAIKAASYIDGHASIYVKTGEYEMPRVPHNSSFAANRKLSIIGESKESVIIYNNDGEYTNGDGAVDSSPLRLSGQVTIKNVTIRALSTEYSGSGTPASYCVHVDFAAADGDIMEIENCRMYNDHYACIGIGLRAGFTLKIRNCELYSVSHDTFAHQGWNGSIICHDGSTAGNPQRIEMYNNIIDCTGDHAVALVPAYNNQIDALFVGNAIFSAGTQVYKGSPVVIDSRTCLNNITIS